MANYRFTKGNTIQYVDADNKDKARKQFCKDQGWKVEKSEKPVLDESIYYQRSSRYDGWKIGNSSTSMQTYGCALMVWSYVAGLDPKEVDKLFVNKKVYNENGQGDSIIFSKACSVLGFKNYEKSKDINRMPKQEMTIKEVWLGWSKHFVIRFNKNNKRDIFDPWTGKHQNINHYKFVSYRIFDKK